MIARRSVATFRRLALTQVTLLSMVVGCNAAPEDDRSPGPPGSSPIESFFVAGQATEGRLEPGGRMDLPGGGTIGLPRSSQSGADVTLVEITPSVEAVEGFNFWYPERSFQPAGVRIAIAPDGEPPPYVILRRPAGGDDSQVVVAAWIDADTSEPDWTPVSSSFDSRTGSVVAGIGLGRFRPSQVSSARASTVTAAEGPAVYTAYVMVSVGGKPFVGQVIVVPEEPLDALEVPVDGPPIPARARVGGSLSLLTHQPLDQLTVTSDFGPRTQPVEGASTNHKGVDYRAANGTDVYAAGDGVVVTSRCQNNSVDCGRTAEGGITGGYIVEIDHGDGILTRYMHMENPADVKKGDTVTGGQVIGRSDSTGGVTAHLHFEVHKDGTPIDPELFDDAQITATLALALDADVQPGTEQQFQLVRGMLTPGDMQRYVDVVDLTGVERGDYDLHFAVIEADGGLHLVLPPVPLTVFDLTGEWQDGPRTLSIVQEGKEVTATIVDGELRCGPGIGTVAFSGTVGEDLLGDPMRGDDLLVCNPEGCEGTLPLTESKEYEAIVEDADTVTLSWESQRFDSECAPTHTVQDSFTITRIEEEPSPEPEP